MNSSEVLETNDSGFPSRLVVRGGRVHNLKNVSIEIPHRRLVVFTGPSGSGKSSLAFDTIFAEGKRRSVQSLSTFARQFVGQFDKPDVDSIQGLCSAIAFDQETTSRNPRSTVGTVTDVYDILRLLFSRIGRPHCSCCGLRMSTAGFGAFHCPEGHAVEPPNLSARAFSFNLPFGACPTCAGLGTRTEVDAKLVVPEPDLSLNDGALAPWASDRWAQLHLVMVRALAQKIGIGTDVAWCELPEPARNTILEGKDIPVSATHAGQKCPFNATYEGVIPWIRRQYAEASSDTARNRLEAFMREVRCPTCGGGRLTPAQMSVTVGGLSIAAVSTLPVAGCLEFVKQLDLTPQEEIVALPILTEMKERLAGISEVGLEYLTLDRSASTLSGGEAQRLKLATQIGTELFGLLYVFDEPTVGLHPHDIGRLVNSLIRLRDQGNTVILVEHDADIIRMADWVVELGPGAGVQGGEIVYSGPLSRMLSDSRSVTGAYLAGGKRIPVPAGRRPRQAQRELVVEGAREHNLKNINVAFPLGCLVAVTGVSGSGKSTLVNDILYRAVARKLHNTMPVPGSHLSMSGTQFVSKVIHINQGPIGRTPRSNAATYTGIFDRIRDVFAKTAEARARGYRSGRFSSNAHVGRCPACSGEGTIRIEMQFLADVYVPCDLCHGTRYNSETLQVKYKDFNVAQVLEMSVEEAKTLFADFRGIEHPLGTLMEVGLGYLRLGQPAPTLSGGEAQRIKLATELQRRPGMHTLYVLDEPTRGLYFEDVRRLLAVLHSLVDMGHTVILTEHNLDVIKSADWVIDLGPGAGNLGGNVVATGTPEMLAATPASVTGFYLRSVLDPLRRRPQSARE